MKAPIFISFVLLLIITVSCTNKKKPQMPPPEVQVVETTSDTVPIKADFLGQTYGNFDISIRARVDGVLEGMFFKEGSRVKKGQLLYKIDPQPFEAEVAQALGQLAEAKTALVKAESDLNRIRPLAEINAVSQSELDGAVAQYGAAKASVDAAEASLRLARIKLGYCEIYSPIDGIIGISEAKVGDYVGRAPNPVVLNAVSQIDTILVRFSITEKEYLKFARHQIEDIKKADMDASGVEKPGLQLILADASTFPNRGFVDFVNRNVDPTTGSLLLQASFPNPDKLLRPGQYAKIRGTIDIAEGVIIIPQRCVMEFQGKHSVYVVGDDNTVASREIDAGPTLGSFWLIENGLKPGEKVVYEGQQKIKAGMKVNPVVQKIQIPEFE